MNAERSVDISAEFPSISENNRKTLQNYYNDCIMTVPTDSTHHAYLVLFRKILSNIGAADNKSVAEWNDDDCVSILQACNTKRTTTVQLRALLHRIIRYAGGTVSKSGYDVKKEYSSSVVTFSDLNEIIQNNFYDKNLDIDWDETNTWSTYIVIAYLLWLGFTKAEIAELRTDDFNPVTSTIVHHCGASTRIRVINEPIITEYLDNYVNSKTYVTRAGGRKTDYSYPDSGNLIKVENSSYENIENYARKLPKYFGLYADEILTAGRMEKLYYLDKIKNIVIEQSNADVIADYVNLSSKRDTLESLISDYQSYRAKRQAG